MMLTLGYYRGIEEIKIVVRWQKRYGDKILFSSDIQDKVIVFVSYLVVNKTKKKYEKVYFTLNMYCCQTYIL